MDQQSVDGGHTQDESDNKPKRNPIQWRHVFDWGFWTDHPLAIFTLFLGGILLAAITSFPGGNPKSLWYVAWGLWIIIGAIIWWIFGGIIAHMEGREMLTADEIEQQEKKYKSSVASQLDLLKEGISNAQVQIAKQRPRSLSASDKQQITDAIAPFAGQKATIMCLIWDTEASRYAQDFASVLNEAEWKCGPIVNSTFPLTFQNVQVGVSDKTMPGSVSPSAVKMIDVFERLGISRQGMNIIPTYSDMEVDTIQIRIGAKPVSD